MKKIQFVKGTDKVTFIALIYFKFIDQELKYATSESKRNILQVMKQMTDEDQEYVWSISEKA